MMMQENNFQIIIYKTATVKKYLTVRKKGNRVQWAII